MLLPSRGGDYAQPENVVENTNKYRIVLQKRIRSSFDPLRLRCGRRFFKRGLCGSKASHRHAEGRTAHVRQADSMAELHGIGITAVFATYPELDVRPHASPFLYRNFHQLANAGLIDRGKRIL